MIIYILIAAVLFTGGISKQGKGIYKIGLFALFFITAFRDPMLGGSDAVFYQLFFKEVPNIFELQGYDSPYAPGYTFLNALVKTFSDNFLVFQFVYTLLSIWLLYLVLEALAISDSEKCLFLFSYFCYRFIWNAWITNRQNIANLLFWLFVILLYKEMHKYREREQCGGRQIIRSQIKMAGLFAAAILLPALFHTAAWVNLILLPGMIFIGRFENDIKKILIPVIVIAFLTFAAKYILEIDVYLYQFLIDLMAGRIDVRYSMYAGTETASSNVINFFFRLVFYFLFVLHYKAEKYQWKDMLFGSFTMMVLMGFISGHLVTRMYEFFAIGLYTGGLAFFFHYFKEKSRLLAAIPYFAGLMIIFFRYIAMEGGQMFLSYSFWF